MDNLMMILCILSAFAIPVLLILFIIRWITKKQKLWFGIALLFCIIGTITFGIIGSNLYLENMTPEERLAYKERLQAEKEKQHSSTSKNTADDEISSIESPALTPTAASTEEIRSSTPNFSNPKDSTSTKETTFPPKTSSNAKTYKNNWKQTFSSHGFTATEISSYEKILTEVGIKSFHSVEIFENGRMHIIKGKIYDSNQCSLHITLEDRKIIVIYFSTPSETTESYINWRGKVKFRHEPSRKCYDLYYDVDGGFVAVLDWETKTISKYEK